MSGTCQTCAAWGYPSGEDHGLGDDAEYRVCTSPIVATSIRTGDHDRDTAFQIMAGNLWLTTHRDFGCVYAERITEGDDE